jgi:hypothetical protein
MRLAELDGNQIELSMTDPGFGNDLIGKGAHAVDRTFQHDGF